MSAYPFPRPDPFTNGVNLAYAYDQLSRLTNVTANGAAAASYGFDLAGNLQAMRYGNGVSNLCEYDSLNRLTNTAWKLNASTLASFYYQLGLTGARTNLAETITNGTRTFQWQYDKLYRLTNEVVTGMAPTGYLGYAYDPVGNRTNRTSTIAQLPSTNSTYGTNDWLNTDAYDSNGNTLWSTNGSFHGPYYYDVENHLTNYANSVYLVYDGDGNRAWKTLGNTNTYYLVDDRNPSGYAQVLEEWTAIGSTSNLSRVYNYGLNLISQRNPSPNACTNYFVFDGHGSARMLTDAGGGFVNAFAYDAYGTLIASNGLLQTFYLYCGQQFDPDLALYYNRARYLNTGTGRFWSRDSTDGDNEDPLSLHKYLYAQADPVDHIDPRGLSIWLCSRTTTDDFPCWGYGRHAYLWDDRPNATPPRDCGEEGNWTYNRCCGTTEPYDQGPIMNSFGEQTNTLPADVKAEIVGGSQGHEEEIMTYARQHINDQILWWPGTDTYGAGGNDCHTAAIRVLSHFPYLTIPADLRQVSVLTI